MFPGMRGMNPRQMDAMMRKMGIRTETVKATKVVIYQDETKIIIKEPSVTIMTVQGQRTFQITGQESKAKRKRKPVLGDGSAEVAEPEPGPDTGPETGPEDEERDTPAYAEEDVKLVMEQAGCTEEQARKSLEDSDGQPAEAILRLMG